MDTSPRPLPLVSVLIPTYNQGRYVATTMQSALSQDYPNLEVIVADDCSTDDTAAVVECLDDARLRFAPSPRNLGRVANYRRGLYALARGEWVLNLDGDDFLVDKSFVSAAVAAASLDDSVALVCADRYECSEPVDLSAFPSGEAARAEPRIVDGTGYVLSLPRPAWRMHHLTTLYRAEVARAIDFYRADIVSSDYESLFRLALGNRLAHLEAKVAVWRRHGGNASCQQDSEKSIRNFALFQSVRDFAIERLGPGSESDFDPWLVRTVSNRYYVTLMSYLRDGDLGGFRPIDRYVKATYPEARAQALSRPKTYVKGVLASCRGIARALRRAWKAA
jgi:glycosyltransferase involved in cell wall biosynthesis